MFKLEWNEGWRWLLLEGLVPLFGAGILYWLFGLARLAAKARSTVKFAWAEAIDPLGWLYGAAILAAQSGWRSYHFHKPLWLTIFCYTVGGLSLIQLIAAMLSRGEDPSWESPLSLKIAAVVLSLAILYAGYNVALVAQH